MNHTVSVPAQFLYTLLREFARQGNSNFLPIAIYAGGEFGDCEAAATEYVVEMYDFERQFTRYNGYMLHPTLGIYLTTSTNDTLQGTRGWGAWGEMLWKLETK